MRRTSILVLYVVTAVVALARTVVAQGNSVEVSYHVPTDVILHQPVMVTLTITNGTADQVTVDLGVDRKEDFVVVVTRPDGVTVGTPRWRASGLGGVMRPHLLSVDPGRAYSQQMALDDWYRIDQAGKYVLDLDLSSTFALSDGTEQRPRTNGRFEIVVAPRDEAKLRELCESLSTSVTRPDSPSEERSDALFAMEHFEDSAVVPCFASTIRIAPSTAYGLLHALERIGSPEARASLVDFTRANDATIVAIARDALRRLDARRR